MQLHARSWNLYLSFAAKYVSLDLRTTSAKLQLYDVRHDVHEDDEVATKHPEVVKRLLVLAQNTRAVIGDINDPRSGQRPAGHVDNPKPLLLALATK